MNIEEKNAIEDIRKTIEYYNERFKKNNKITTVLIDNFDVDNLFILLNLIEKQQAELQDKDNYLEQISQCLNNIAIDQIPIAIAELKFFIDLKDKQIDLMAKEIDKEPNPDICKQMQGMECNNREILCTECIKQYFIKKASE